ncbi:MAG: HAD-IIIC family phosphatase [Acidobacteriota bacterium]
MSLLYPTEAGDRFARPAAKSSLFDRMKLLEALKIKDAPGGGEPFSAFLACGFTPLHLQVFFTAYLRQRLPDRLVDVSTGLYDDLAGSLALTRTLNLDGLFVALEWPDLDPRLGLRQLGGWSPAKLPEIAESAVSKLKILEAALYAVAERTPIVLSPPLWEMPPLFYTTQQQLHPEAAEIEAQVAAFLARATRRGVRVLRPTRIAGVPSFDIRSYLKSGIPYPPQFSSGLAQQAVNLLLPPSPKKGLITDLDNTLWKGIVGEVGAAEVSWDLAGKAQIHGIYQAMLQSMADAGVLIGVASKNDPVPVQEAMQREDFLLSPASVFPVEANWAPKSESIARILKAWNIGEDAVVFVDDSPMEVAQVASAFPSITSLCFPSDDAEAAWQLLYQLRNLFGKSALTGEDSLRVDSLRNSAERDQALESSGLGIEEFLEHSQAVVRIEPVRVDDARALDLINKTNQFNLNGRRWTEAEWRKLLEMPSTLAVAVTYEDKYGRLGKIAVLAGTRQGSLLRVHCWVMSCRAFSRRIEYQCLQTLFNRCELDRIQFDFFQTSKNGPLRDFLLPLTSNATGPSAAMQGDLVLARNDFDARCPALFHAVRADELLLPVASSPQNP